MSQYRLIFTNIGLSKKQNAELNNDYIEITQFAVGSGVIANLQASMTALVTEEYRADINNVDTKNGVTIFDLIVPSSVGGFYIKEVALFDVDGDCICIGTVPITYKVNQDEGASKSIHLKVSTTSTNTENIVFNTDDSLVYATVSYVNNEVGTLRNELLQYINNINIILASDDTSLDEIQELVNFIKQNRDDLDTLTISNISGLQSVLNAKQAIGNYITISSPQALNPVSVLELIGDDLYLQKGDNSSESVNLSKTGTYIVAQSLGINGYKIWSDGSIEQWAFVSECTSPEDFRLFPIAFPNVCTNIQVTGHYSSSDGWSSNWGVVAGVVDNTKFLWNAAGTFNAGGWAYITAIGK